MRFLILDKFGWPVERIKGRYVQNFLRLLIHGRKIVCRECWKQEEKLRLNMPIVNMSCCGQYYKGQNI